MKTIRVHQFGGLEVLARDEVQVPEPGEGEARVKIEAIGVNFIDIYHRTGAYKGALPLTLGHEISGMVEAVGPGAESWAGKAVLVPAVMHPSYARCPLFGENARQHTGRKMLFNERD